MKVNVLWLVQWIVIRVALATLPLQTSSTKTSLISNAVIDVISKSFFKDSPIINFITTTEQDEGLNDIINEASRNISATVSVRINDQANVHYIMEPGYYNVIFVTDFKGFERFNQILNGKLFYFDGFYLVVMAERYENQYEDMLEILRHMWQRFVINVNILILASNAELQLFTFYPFTSAACGSANPTLTNRFINSSFIPSSADYYDTDKLKNLHGCPLKVATFNIPPLLFIGEHDDGSRDLRGIDGELLSFFADQMNFTIDLILVEDVKWGFLYPNGSTSPGAMNLIMEKKADLTIGKYAQTYLRNTFMSPSISYYSSPLVVVVPLGAPYTSLEKLMKPFSAVVWVFVAIILIAAFLIINSVKWRFGGAGQQFVFGFMDSSPFFNTVNVFLGGTMTRLPRQNFARSLLCMFLLYCIVIRNSYTGALFKFITSDNGHHPTMQSVEEMAQQDFHFYMIPPNVELISKMETIFNRRRIIQPNEIRMIQDKLNNPNFKGGLLSNLEQLLYFNRINHRNYMLSYCPDFLRISQYSIYFPQHSYLVKRFDRLIEQFQENGKITSLVQKYVQLLDMEGTKTEEPLTLRQVWGSFILLIVGLSTAVIVGVLEMVSLKNHRLKKFFDHL